MSLNPFLTSWVWLQLKLSCNSEALTSNYHWWPFTWCWVLSLWAEKLRLEHHEAWAIQNINKRWMTWCFVRTGSNFRRLVFTMSSLGPISYYTRFPLVIGWQASCVLGSGEHWSAFDADAKTGLYLKMIMHSRSLPWNLAVDAPVSLCW